MKRIILVFACFSAGCLLGVGFAWASSPMILPNTCLAYGDEGDSDDYEVWEICDAHVEVNLVGGLDGGKAVTCPPATSCFHEYQLDGSWTPGNCLDRVDLYMDNGWVDGEDIPSGNGGPPAHAPIYCHTSCPNTHIFELEFRNGTTLAMSLYWETKCFICPGPL